MYIEDQNSEELVTNNAYREIILINSNNVTNINQVNKQYLDDLNMGAPVLCKSRDLLKVEIMEYL